jgi:hypothetical protein
MAATPSQGPGLRRSLSVWQAVGLSLALMAPSMAANINPQGAASAGRAVPPGTALTAREGITAAQQAEAIADVQVGPGLAATGEEAT